MTKEEKQLLIKDLSARLPYGVKCRASYNKFPSTLVDVNVDPNIGDDLFIVTVKLEKTGLNSPSLIEDIKPYLRPMSSMTKEEKEIYDCFAISYRDSSNVMLPSPMAIDFLLSHHFDFRGLIEKGLALEAPEGMYETIKTE